MKFHLILIYLLQMSHTDNPIFHLVAAQTDAVAMVISVAVFFFLLLEHRVENGSANILNYEEYFFNKLQKKKKRKGE